MSQINAQNSVAMNQFLGQTLASRNFEKGGHRTLRPEISADVEMLLGRQQVQARQTSAPQKEEMGNG